MPTRQQKLEEIRKKMEEISGGFGTLKKRIATEGITGPGGEVWLAPSEKEEKDEPFVPRYQAGYETEEEKKEREYYEGLPKEEPTEEEKKAIQRHYNLVYQAQIDAINKLYAGLVSREEEAGVGRLGQTRAMGARAGLLGSPMGVAQMEKTREFTAENIKAIQAERSLKMAAIFTRVDERATEEIRERRKESKENAERYVAYLKKNLEKNKEDYAGLAESGVTLSRLKANRDYYEQALEEIGMSEMEFDFWYESKMPKLQRSDFTEYQYRGDNGNVWIKKIAFNPETGDKTEYNYDIGVPYAVEEEIKTFGGVPYKAVKDTEGNITRYERVPGVEGAEGEGVTEEAYKSGMLADKDDGMTYDEAVSSYSAVLDLDYIDRIYGEGKYKEEPWEEKEAEIKKKFYEDIESWDKKVEDEPDKYYKKTEGGVVKYYQKKWGWVPDKEVFSYETK